MGLYASIIYFGELCPEMARNKRNTTQKDFLSQIWKLIKIKIMLIYIWKSYENHPLYYHGAFKNIWSRNKLYTGSLSLVTIEDAFEDAIGMLVKSLSRTLYRMLLKTLLRTLWRRCLERYEGSFWAPYLDSVEDVIKDDIGTLLRTLLRTLLKMLFRALLKTLRT